MSPTTPAAAPTVVGVEPLYLDNAALIAEGKDFAAAANKIEVVPSTSTATFRGLKRGAVFSNTAVESYALNIDFAQDFETATSFSNYCYENEGKIETFTIAPKDGGQAWTVKAQIVPGSIGGAGAAHAVSSISLPVQGKPEKVTATSGS